MQASTSVYPVQLFPTSDECSAAALQDVKRIVGAHRSDLNVTTASGKGRVAGSVQLLQPQAARWLDCTTGTFAVPGDVNDIRCANALMHTRAVQELACCDLS